MRMAAVLAVVVAGSALAEQGDPVPLHAAFLAGPTAWCAKDAGVPVVVTMSGLRVHKPLLDPAQSTRVRMRKGGAVQEVEVGTLAPGQIRERRGATVRQFETSGTASFEQARREQDGDAEFLGLLSVSARVCKTFWSHEVARVDWRLDAPGGALIREGTAQPRFPRLGFARPSLINARAGQHPSIQIGDENFAVIGDVEMKLTTETFVSPTEELSK